MGSFSADVAGLKGSFHGYDTSPEELSPVFCKALLLTMFLAECQDQIYNEAQ